MPSAKFNRQRPLVIKPMRKSKMRLVDKARKKVKNKKKAKEKTKKDYKENEAIVMKTSKKNQAFTRQQTDLRNLILANLGNNLGISDPIDNIFTFSSQKSKFFKNLYSIPQRETKDSIDKASKRSKDNNRIEHNLSNSSNTYIEESDVKNVYSLIISVVDKKKQQRK